MPSTPEVEPWMRGPLAGVSTVVAPVLFSFQQAREDLARWTEGLTTDEIWARPYGFASAGFHIRHLGASAERLATYLAGEGLSAAQLEVLGHEMDPGATVGELLAEMDLGLRKAEGIVRGVDVSRLAEARFVGRKRFPTTVIGLLVHIAEHTQRHVGQAIAAAKLARAAGA